MDGLPADHEQKFQSAHQLYLATKKSFRDLDIPPRKLLTRRLQSLSSEPSMDIMYESPKVLSEETLFQKFLPNNISSVDDDDSDPYASDEFRMYEFKIRKCTRSRSHDWTDCPFAHPGEKARRRCTRRFNYSGEVCADFRRGNCLRGDKCEFAHGVFESWLHPSRYRTEACKDGMNCQRKICFFAHTQSQLRSISVAEKRVNAGHCSYCRYYPGIHHTTSPTSILDIDQQSPQSSPPISPAQLGGGFSPVSRFAGASWKESKKGLMNHQGIEEVMQSMKVMSMNAINQGPNPNPNLIKFESFPGTDDQNSFFSYSPLTPSSSACGPSRVLPGECNYPINALNEGNYANETSTSGPDLDWVNDLLT